METEKTYKLGKFGLSVSEQELIFELSQFARIDFETVENVVKWCKQNGLDLYKLDGNNNWKVCKN